MAMGMAAAAMAVSVDVASTGGAAARTVTSDDAAVPAVGQLNVTGLVDTCGCCCARHRIGRWRNPRKTDAKSCSYNECHDIHVCFPFPVLPFETGPLNDTIMRYLNLR